jgi:hypothetical protein
LVGETGVPGENHRPAANIVFRNKNFRGFCKFRCVRFELFSIVDYIVIFQLYRGSKFYWWRKQAYPEKNTDLSQVGYLLLFTIRPSSRTTP